MSILEDFEVLSKEQDDSVEIRLGRYAIQDKTPTIIYADDMFNWTFKCIMNNPDDLSNHIDIRSMMTPGRTYIYPIHRYTFDQDTCTGINNNGKGIYDAYGRKLFNFNYNINDSYEDHQIVTHFIGSSENGLEGISKKQWDMYIDLYSKEWGEEYVNELKKKLCYASL